MGWFASPARREGERGHESTAPGRKTRRGAERGEGEDGVRRDGGESGDLPDVCEGNNRHAVEGKVLRPVVCAWIEKPTKVPVRGTIDPRALPFARWQKAHAYARFSASVSPPCFSLMLWSTAQPKTASSS